nr:unnamed protein product [Haemonchus contortus]
MPVIAINECPSERSAPSNGEAQEIVQPNDENLKRASAGGIGGLSGNELFLVVVAICVVVFNAIRLIFAYEHVNLIVTIAALAVAVLAIVAVLTKSSILMLIVLIALIIVAVLITIALVFTVIAWLAGYKAFCGEFGRDTKYNEDECNCREITKHMGASHTVVADHLEQFGMVKKLDKWVPHKPTEHQQ